MSLVEQHGAIKIMNEIDSIWNEATETHGFVNSCPDWGWEVTSKLCIQSSIITNQKKLQLSYAANQVKKHSGPVAVILKLNSDMKKVSRSSCFTEKCQKFK